MSCIVVGTGTGVGKTVACAALLSRKPTLRYWKPIGTGTPSDSAVIARLCPNEILPQSYSFTEPQSPHLAARLDGRRVSVARLRRDFARHARQPLLIEGVGGVLVPLGPILLIDFLRQLNLPVIVVATSAVGTINHTLLTLEALRARQFTLAGVILNGPEHRENARAIKKYGKVRILGQLPILKPLNRAKVATAGRGIAL